MERNRIQEFLVELPDQEHGIHKARFGAAAAPPSSFVAMPETLWTELGSHGQHQLAAMYQAAFQLAEAQVRRECVERLLESIAIR
jgi:hypothetical protein